MPHDGRRRAHVLDSEAVLRRRTLLLLVVAFAVVAVVLLRARRFDGATVDIGSTTSRDVFRSYVTASGEIVATRFADVGSSVMGRVVELAVREGDQVTRGQILARIDAVQARGDRDAAEAQIAALQADVDGARDQVVVARAELESAEARSSEAAKALARMQQLYGQGLAPTAERDAAVAAADAAAAQARAARSTIARAEQARAAAERRVVQARALATRARDVLDKTNITAPIDGIVSRLQVREGEMVVIGIQNQPGTTLMTISDLSSVNAEVKVAEADVLRLQLGQPATVTLDAVAGGTFSGRVVEIGASALPVQGTGAAAREFRVVVRLDRAAGALRPGLTCDAEILAQERRDVVTAPLQAVVLRAPAAGQPETTGVFVVTDGVAQFTPVKTGIIGGLDIEVAGVPASTAIVTGPFPVLRTLQGGTRVRAAADGAR
jgi:HlyD family secretion protein